MHPAKTYNQGLGLVILVLTILALALAAGGILIGTKSLLTEQRYAATQAKLRLLAQLISSTNFPSPPPAQRHYEQDVGALPTSLNDLLVKPVAVAACASNMTTHVTSGWCGPYWTDTFQNDDTFADAWDNALVYDSGARTLTSYGADGAAGGGDDLVQSF